MFENKDSLVQFMIEHGAERILFKCLAENDNSKQQIYLGGSFETLNQIPFGEVYPDNINGKVPNYKASLQFHWINDEGQIECAPRAQLILYPKYPEVRLSGFLQNCSIAPRDHLQPVPIGERRYNNGKDGRVLVMGMCTDGRILAHLVPSGTPLSNELTSLADNINIFSHIVIESRIATKAAMLSKIQEIQDRGWILGSRMNSQGEVVRYNAQNAGGYTFEACMGIIPNGRAEPDWMGWELKAFTSNRITLMTPEPNAGYYGENGVESFVQRFGRARPQGDSYFTGIHKCGSENATTGMSMIIDGYDAQTSRIVNVTGGLTLLDSNGNPAAIWTFAKLIEHWGRKHAHAVYIPYQKRITNGNYEYKYINPVKFGEGTDFNKFLNAFNSGVVFYDPANKLFTNDRGNSQTKARNQFRMRATDLSVLYYNFTNETLSLNL